MVGGPSSLLCLFLGACFGLPWRLCCVCVAGFVGFHHAAAHLHAARTAAPMGMPSSGSWLSVLFMPVSCAVPVVGVGASLVPPPLSVCILVSVPVRKGVLWVVCVCCVRALFFLCLWLLVSLSPGCLLRRLFLDGAACGVERGLSVVVVSWWGVSFLVLLSCVWSSQFPNASAVVCVSIICIITPNADVREREHFSHPFVCLRLVSDGEAWVGEESIEEKSSLRVVSLSSTWGRGKWVVSAWVEGSAVVSVGAGLAAAGSWAGLAVGAWWCVFSRGLWERRQSVCIPSSWMSKSLFLFPRTPGSEFMVR
jgi:hypothetical protein